MQEKVHFKPPEIKIFEGKTPPTSWFNENIVRYYQIKSEREFLNDFVTFVQRAESEKLEKNRQEGKLVLEFAYIPEGEGSADEIANASIFNAFQTHVGTEIQFLKKLIAILKKGNPQFAKELKSDLDALNQIVKAFPQLSQEQLMSLSSLMNKLNEMVNKTPLSTQKAFWEEENRMLEKMIKMNNLTLEQFEELVGSLQKKMEEMGKFKTAFTSIVTLFTKGQVQEGLSQFMALLRNYKFLSPELQKSFSAVLSKAGKMKGKKDISFVQLLAEAQLNQWIKNIGGKPSRQQILDYLHEEMSKPPFDSMSPPFMSNFLEALRKNIDSPDFPATASLLGPSFEDVEKLSQAVSSFEFDPKSAKKALDDIEDHLTEQLNHTQNQIEGIKKAAPQVKVSSDHLGKSACWGASKAASSGSLPNQFARAILNHYMPGQEKYLMELSEVLMFDNMGASIGNSLMSMVTDFSSAATNYDFSNFLHGDGKGEFNGTPTQAKNRLQKERTQSENDLKETEKALKKIKDEIKKIKNDKKLTASQKKQMTSKLKKTEHNFETAKNQLSNLHNLLENIHISSGKDSKHFKVSGPHDWEKHLSRDEDDVINGEPNKDYPGGLVKIASEINSFQSHYSDQGQNQQMMLQMRMTEIQQEWTVVSTALQLLNQMFMTVAQGIYK